LTERYWNDVYPRLDPDDNNDPTQRLNILNSLSSPAEPYKFTLHLKQIVLCDSQTMGRITLQQILSAQDASGTSDSGAGTGNSAPDINQIQAAFRDAGSDAAQARLTLVTETIDHAESLQNFIESAVGAGKGVNFDSLNQLLGEMRKALEPYAANGAPSAETGESDSVAATGGSGRAAPAPISGAIQTRGDVIRALTMICDYYRNNEPSSPVPLILQRAQRLVDKDFMAIVTDLTPDALSQLKVITGKTDGE
jgi:type VI secretion system protein ImpA